MTINDLLTTYHLTQTELSRRFDIPLRTVQHWCNGTRQPADWLVRLIEKCLANDI